MPAGYQAVDVVAGRVRGTVVTCFSVNPGRRKTGGSFVLQVTPTSANRGRRSAFPACMSGSRSRRPGG